MVSGLALAKRPIPSLMPQNIQEPQPDYPIQRADPQFHHRRSKDPFAEQGFRDLHPTIF